MPDTAYALAETASPVPLHRLPARLVDPPYDDDSDTESPAAARSTQGTLALAFPLPSGVPAIPSIPATAPTPHPDAGSQSTDGHSPRQPAEPRPTSAHLTLVRPPAPESELPAVTSKRSRRAQDLALDDFGPQRTPRALLPAPTPWAGRLVQAIVEVIGGARPLAQLVRWTNTDVYDAVRRRGRYLATVDGGVQRQGAIVRSVHVVEPGDGVAEVCAVVQHGSRCRAVALRLEGVDGRWQCTALQLG